MRALLLTLALALAACSPAPEKKATVVEAPAPDVPVKDHRLLLPADHQTSATVVRSHILDNKTLPGGSLGEYEAQGRKYQLFIVESTSAQEAAFLMLDFKDTLKNPVYIAYMGGYFGEPMNPSGTPAGDKPVYVFAKGNFLAGVVGLSQAMADPIARELAARL